MKTATQMPRWFVWAAGGMVALIVVPLTLSALHTSPSDAGGVASAPVAADVGNEGSARLECQDFVKRLLKSPSTAHFSETSSTGENPAWTVRGAVDSDNSFGAPIRNTYVCRIHYDGNNRWTARSITGVDN